MPINTAKVKGRRKLDYASFDELLADAERMTSGPVKTLGNWSAGQIFKHLAIVFNGSIDGMPITFPWYFRLVVRLFKKQILKGNMPAGYQMKNENADFAVPGPTTAEEGLAALRAAVERLKRDTYREVHPLMGNLNQEEWDKLHLKHASLHMSFLIPG